MRKALVLLVLVSCGSCAPRQGVARKTPGSTPAKTGQTRYVDDANTAGWTGSDVCAQEQSAEADLPSYGGDINMQSLASATNYSCSGTWTIGKTKPVRLWLPNQAIVVTPTGSNPAITVTTDGTFLMGYNPSTQYLPGGSSRLQFGGTGTGVLMKWTASYGGMQDVGLEGPPNPVPLLQLVASSTTEVMNNSFRNIAVACYASTSGAIGVELTANNVNALVSGNVFNPFTAMQCDRGIKLDTSNNQGPTNNTFQFYISDTVNGTACIDVQSGSSNVFMNGECQGGNYATGFNVASGATANGLIGSRIEGSTISVNDAGTGTTYVGDSFTDCSTNIFAASAVLLGGWSNTNCNFDQLPRGLSVGFQGLRVNGGTALTGTSQAQATIVTSLNGANAVPSGTMQYQFGCSGTATSSTTLMLQPGGNQGTNACNVTAGNTFVIVPVTGGVSNLFCEAGTGGKAAGSGQVTIQRASPATSGFSNTSITCTMGKGQTCKDISHSQVFSAGDALRVTVATQGSEALSDIHCAVVQQ